MKRAWIAAGLLLALLGASLAHSICIDRFAHDLTSLLNEAEDCAGAGDWSGAERLTAKAKGLWEKRDAYLHVTLCRNQLDTVRENFCEVSVFIRSQAAEEYFAANARLLSGISLMAEAEQLTIKNIL